MRSVPIVRSSSKVRCLQKIHHVHPGKKNREKGRYYKKLVLKIAAE